MKEWTGQVLYDVRHALRSLRRSPGFTAAAVLTLTLGIGANVATFGIVDRLMFRPYAFLRDPATVHRIYLEDTRPRGTLIRASGVEYLRYLDFARTTSSFSELAAFAHPVVVVGDGDGAREQRVAAVTGTFWSFFDARPALGRFFTPAEDAIPRGDDVAVLGYAYWQAQFGGRDVVGGRITVGRLSPTIIGVAPRGFSGVSDDEPSLWVPVTTWASAYQPDGLANFYSDYSWGWLSMMARRKPGISTGLASDDASRAYWLSWEAERAMNNVSAPAAVAQPRAHVSAMRIAGGPDPSLEARTALWLMLVAGIVLFIACANVANLLLARALRRQRETAVRLALGVSRWRLGAQSAAESMVLAVVGAVGGVFVAYWIGGVLGQRLSSSGSLAPENMLDWRTFGYAAAITLLVSLITALAPAVLSGRGDLAPAFKAGVREGTVRRSRTRTTLMVTQVALSVVLLVGATLFVRSLHNVANVPLGYDPEHTLIVTRNLVDTPMDGAARIVHRREMLDRARAIPGVERVAWVSSVPYWSTSATALFVPGVDSVSQFGQFTYQLATADYFDAIGTHIIRGRGLDGDDRMGAPRVAVVSASMAATLWPGDDAIGQCIRVGADTAPCSTIVGVAEDIVQRSNQLGDVARLHYYLPLEQVQPDGGRFAIVRTTGRAEEYAETVRAALQSVMTGRSYVSVRPLNDGVADAQRSWRLGATAFSAFGILALLVASVGLYGVVSYSVTQRMHEVGVRVALGARPLDILGLVAGQSARLTGAGVVIGTCLAIAASRWIAPLLYQQAPIDATVYLTVGVIMLCVALVAAAAPAARAARVDPNAALRSE